LVATLADLEGDYFAWHEATSSRDTWKTKKVGATKKTQFRERFFVVYSQQNINKIRLRLLSVLPYSFWAPFLFIFFLRISHHGIFTIQQHILLSV